MIALVVAYGENGVIGRDGELPWRLPSDLARFRALTHGGTVVMGRKTWESLPPRFRPLPGRRNIVLSRAAAYAPEGAEVFASLDEALAACERDCFVIGGAEIYAQALPLAERVLATCVDAAPRGDAFFAPLEDDGAWECVERSAPQDENGHVFTFRTYERST
ncbi:dihydrofolate reductase [Conexibacter sp. CPCC 206217]|uniref:dihydrofolate reductase n=1 Tax=Conexibacter sp. CPCC 206217 TaxID=3064574 RepID=UPI00271C7BEE|nr:dihydrofolate reductase [Conexibacter sp. CPCC 206217]MDO8211194.1 dihydrofolate reductase [Conexibacter sp. CPCC 206217]